MSKKALDDTDVFILDTGAKIYQVQLNVCMYRVGYEPHII